MKLFIYDHCPYCVRARMVFGLKNIPIETVILAYDDESTPISLIGQKVLPILEKKDGTYMKESLDIVKYIDQNFGTKPILSMISSDEISAIIADIQEINSILLYPRFLQLNLPEFATQSAKDYFEKKKSIQSGSISHCLAQTEQVVKKIEVMLAKLALLLVSSNACNGELSFDDICLFPILRNLTCVKALQFPLEVKNYIESLSAQSKVNTYFERAI